jgi:sugar lactone lactonase YvrE
VSAFRLATVAALHVAALMQAERAQAGPYTVTSLDRTADGTPLFQGPVAVRWHPDGRLFVVDDLSHRLLVFGAHGDPLQTFGGHGPGPGELMWPDAVHWDATGDLLVADTGANRIQVWRADGRYVREFGRLPRWRRAVGPGLGVLALALIAAAAVLWTTAPLGRSLAAPVAALAAGMLAAGGWAYVTFVLFGGLQNPRDVLVGPGGLVYVSDFGGHAVRVFDRAGGLVRSIGSDRRAGGSLKRPLGLGQAGGRLFVADSGNSRVQVFSADGTFIRSLGRRGSGPGELDTPHGLAIGPDGLLYIADRGNARIQLWTTDGTVVRIVTPPPEPGRTEAFAPGGLSVDDVGTLAVADIAGHRVVVMRPQP